MNAGRRSDGGVPSITRRVAELPGNALVVEESWPGANQAKDEKLRLRGVQRRVGAGGLELRHSDYGYALIGTDRKSVNGRNDMSLKEIESWLDTAPER